MGLALIQDGMAGRLHFIGISVHLSTKKLVEKSILKRPREIKVPRRDAYGSSPLQILDKNQ